MARVTVEDCLDFVENRFELALLAARRARQLLLGRAEPLVPWNNDKPSVVALREFASGRLSKAVIEATDEEHKHQQYSQVNVETDIVVEELNNPSTPPDVEAA